ncbi:glycosyl hydrolase family 95 catalytic domain-containing protein [Runella salmonicolor]|uniref:Glycoside hydrolase family 95 protein n=1 Tax=Runella salmonicolor TaxID=2950278 RepID=A0ABT1FLM5_9BACT|nr:glycoside hydrolase N-terminal domain-containing protein [Runella salmonicolor]MCP1382659.1 glycoside hydrolase family 95 protein [Runella salmonicolor]
MLKRLLCLFLGIFLRLTDAAVAQVSAKHDLVFDKLPTRWDEALPLGNGFIGELIWQKGNNLRFSLDHAELWDLRPMEGMKKPEFTYAWVQEQIKKNNYAAVQQYGDVPYEREPAPSKIPGAALEIESQTWGEVSSARVDIQKAIAEVKWANGAKLTSFVHASALLGYFRLEGVKDFKISLLAPKYEGEVDKTAGGSVAGDDLARLGYQQGKVLKQGNAYTYRQKGWGGFEYEVSVRWKTLGVDVWEGVWAISAHYPNKPKPAANTLTAKIVAFEKAALTHQAWWKNFWAKSSIELPDAILEKQYYLEQYKFGSTARRGAPPISLQAVWTADNGRLPPWKGDFHHDLNTQLSYWPGYTANHLEETLGYLDHLDQNRPAYREYTKWFYQSEGINVPGVTTLTGVPMGGWIQYSFSPTVSSWLAQHYYLQWRYSMDRDFLQKRAYPWFKEVATFLEKNTFLNAQGQRQLPISSSPEINDNRVTAWFSENTNYDLSLMRFTFSKAAELAAELKLTQEAAHWRDIFSQFAPYALSENAELKFTPSLPYNQSHRHFSHVMAIHPLGEIRWENGENDQAIIKNSLALLDKIGPDWWCGYSYAWLGSLKARAKDGTGAAKTLRTFATAFCLPNSFHANGDQTKSGLSKFTYRPFTLEGNFAFAAGVQEMLLQSYAGFIEVFPAVPADWKDVSFKELRAEGAVLVSGKRTGGLVDEVILKSEKGGIARLKLPFKTHFVKEKKGAVLEKMEKEFVEVSFEKGGFIVFKNGYE